MFKSLLGFGYLMSKKRDIIDAAIFLFAQNGFSATPTTAVAKKAGVAQGLIFHYFKTKEGILVEIIAELGDKYISETDKIIANSENGLDAIINIIQFHFMFENENTTELMVLLLHDIPPAIDSQSTEASIVLCNRIDQTIAQLKECINKGQADGSIRNDASSESAFIIRALLNGLSRLHFSMQDKPDYKTAIFEAIQFCRKSLEI